ncbi:MAG: hypothetical protein KAV87_58180 [Desulfobacteraceae bacterium]|nr:hypothetical protein [Desulfobacteraceae bacterium]
MKYALCGNLVGLSDAYIQAIKTKLKAIPKVAYWLKDAHFTKSVNDEDENVVTFMIPFHKKAIRSNFVQNWIRFYWETKIVTDPETGEKTEVRIRKFEVKDAIKTLWQKCKPGSRIWIELHDHDQEARRGCRIEDVIRK